MTKPNVQIGDLVREMTDDEYAQYQEDQAVAEAAQQALNAQKIAKENALAKLGLTNEELSALLS
jgi:hypothetical protein